MYSRKQALRDFAIFFTVPSMESIQIEDEKNPGLIKPGKNSYTPAPVLALRDGAGFGAIKAQGGYTQPLNPGGGSGNSDDDTSEYPARPVAVGQPQPQAQYRPAQPQP